MANYLTNPQGLDPYSLIMDEILNNNPGLTQKQIEDLMEVIKYHETDGTMDPAMKQYKHKGATDYGPGRGLYQYELDRGDGSGSGRAAMQRLYNTVGEEGLPKWAFKYFDRNPNTKELDQEGDVDFSELTSEQQDLLFLADKLQDPIAGNLGAIGVESDSLWWQKYHHKGGGDTAKFDSSRASYLNNRR